MSRFLSIRLVWIRSVSIRLAALATAAVVLLGSVGAAAEPDVTIAGDRVSAELRDVPTPDVVAAIAAVSGAEVVGGVDRVDPVSITLDEVPVAEALERVLGGQSFTIVYGGDGSIRRIRLLGGAGGGESGPAKAAARRGLKPHELFAAEVRVSSAGPLFDALGSDTTTLGQLFEIAAKNEQANLRLAAVDAGVTAIEADPDLQSAVDELLDLSEDGQLANMARLGAGERAAELVSRILSRTRRPAVRQRAVSVLRSLRQQN
jgi:hypothetical protein